MWQYIPTKHAEPRAILFYICCMHLESGKKNGLWHSFVTSEVRHMPSYSLVDRYQRFEWIYRLQIWILDTLWCHHLKSHALSVCEDAALYNIYRSESFHIKKAKLLSCLFFLLNAQTKVHFSISCSSSRFFLYVGTYLPNCTRHILLLLLLLVFLSIPLQVIIWSILSYTKDEVLAAVLMIMPVLWGITTCIFLCRYQHFQAHCLQLLVMLGYPNNSGSNKCTWDHIQGHWISVFW